MLARHHTSPLFSVGQLVATPAALQALETAGQTAAELIQRHVRLDPGDLGEEDQLANVAALADGDRVLSSYLLKDGVKVWVITEADRSSTCVVLPNEY